MMKHCSWAWSYLACIPLHLSNVPTHDSQHLNTLSLKSISEILGSGVKTALADEKKPVFGIYDEIMINFDKPSIIADRM